MKKSVDDYWRPLAGSWEELVEPYNVQRHRKDENEKSGDDRSLPVDTFVERPTDPSQRLPISA